jgi:hypothetical protein
MKSLRECFAKLLCLDLMELYLSPACLADVCLMKACLMWSCLIEVCLMKVCLMEVCLKALCLIELCLKILFPKEVCLMAVYLIEDHLAKVHSVKPCLIVVETYERGVETSREPIGSMPHRISRSRLQQQSRDKVSYYWGPGQIVGQLASRGSNQGGHPFAFPCYQSQGRLDLVWIQSVPNVQQCRQIEIPAGGCHHDKHHFHLNLRFALGQEMRAAACLPMMMTSLALVLAAAVCLSTMSSHGQSSTNKVYFPLVMVCGLDRQADDDWRDLSDRTGTV